MTFDPLNLLLLAIALVVFWRLRSVLGTRTGNERPPLDPINSGQEDTRKPGESAGTVTRFPQADNAEPRRGLESEPPEPVWKGFAEAGSPLAATLEELALSDPAFTPKSFVEGAKAAYEMIIEAFAKGNKASLKNLLSKEVFDDFATAIDARESAGQKVESRFVGVEKATIEAASLIGDKANVTIKFVSELISATFGKAGELVEGDPKQVREVTDFWTFERDITSRNPNWKLVATQAPA